MHVFPYKWPQRGTCRPRSGIFWRFDVSEAFFTMEPQRPFCAIQLYLIVPLVKNDSWSPTPRSHWLLDELLVVGETQPTTLLFADPPTALAVTAEGASCVARAVPSDSVSCMLAARRIPTDRFADGVPGAGREPSARSWKGEQPVRGESCDESAAS